MTGKIAILDHFSALEDPRQAWKVVYPLPEIMLLILAATIAGADDFVEIEEWGNERLDFLRTFLPYEHGIPSHDALNDLVNALDPELFKACFTSWVATLREDDPDIIAIDGKTSRRTHNRARGREPLHLVSAWAARQRLVLAQQAIDAKSNEIKAIPLLLERLALNGALVTIDAIGTQTEIAEMIVEKGGDYCLALKENRPVLYGDVERFFADPPPDAVATFKTTDGDHGRLEERVHRVCHDVAWLFSDRRYAGEPAFPHLAMIGMVESRTERGGKVEHERRYYLCSAKLEADTFARVKNLQPSLIDFPANGSAKIGAQVAVTGRFARIDVFRHATGKKNTVECRQLSQRRRHVEIAPRRLFGEQRFGQPVAVTVDEIFVLSDGEPTAGDVRDAGELLRIVKEANKYAKVRINTVFTGRGRGADLLRRLAEENGGVFVHR